VCTTKPDQRLHLAFVVMVSVGLDRVQDHEQSLSVWVLCGLEVRVVKKYCSVLEQDNGCNG
jgi:hypothetical protein